MGKIIPIPDIEYKHWCNTNKEFLEEIIKKGKVNTAWLTTGNNRAYLERYYEECGYKISID